MMRSFTIFLSLNHDVVGAYEPMPSVSKKFVTKPTISCSTVCNRTSVAGVFLALPRLRAVSIAFPQIATKPAFKVDNAARRTVIGFMQKSPFLVLRGAHTTTGLLGNNVGRKGLSGPSNGRGTRRRPYEGKRSDGRK